MFNPRNYANKDLSAQEYVCLSTDEKKTEGIANGSVCIEMDTGDVYFFDKSGSQWIKL